LPRPVPKMGTTTGSCGSDLLSALHRFPPREPAAPTVDLSQINAFSSAAGARASQRACMAASRRTAGRRQTRHVVPRDREFQPNRLSATSRTAGCARLSQPSPLHIIGAMDLLDRCDGLAGRAPCLAAAALPSRRARFPSRGRLAAGAPVSACPSGRRVCRLDPAHLPDRSLVASWSDPVCN